MNLHGDNDGMVCTHDGKILMALACEIDLELAAYQAAGNQMCTEHYLPLDVSTAELAENAGLVLTIPMERQGIHYCNGCNDEHLVYVLNVPGILYHLRNPTSSIKILTDVKCSANNVSSLMKYWMQEKS